MTIYIQKRELDKQNSTYQFDGCYSAHEGAEHRVMPVIMFEDIMEVPARKNVMVVACVEDTRTFFERVGIKEPPSINVPQFICDAGYITRKLGYMTLNEFKGYQVDRPMFVKPLLKVKAFPSGINTKRSMLNLVLSDYEGSWDIPVLVSEVVDMVSEYRVYVSKRKGIVGMKHYQGDEFVYPNNDYIKRVVDKLRSHPDMPDSFSADFAVIDNYTELIEVQDAWAIGAYGLDGEIYLSFLMERWHQLMK